MSITVPTPAPGAGTQPQPLSAGVLPLLYTDTPADAMAWVTEHRATLRASVLDHGALLVRGLGIRDPATLSGILDRLGAPPVTETESFSPRQRHADGVYSSSKWPPNQPMCMHHELSYAVTFPAVLLFACLSPPTTGGATAVADSTAVLQALPPAVTERFIREGWILTRSYGNDIGTSLKEAFATDDRGSIENYCRTHAISFAWQSDGTLRTRQRRSAVVGHPVTAARCWFNQIAFLSEWTIDPEIREYLIDEYGPDGLPFNTFHGNGDPVAPETVRLLNDVYEAHTVRRPWQAGDLLLVDNIRTAHSREAFTGPRHVIVAMGEPQHLNDCSPTIEVTLP